jgi:hypothetical protein
VDIQDLGAGIYGAWHRGTPGSSGNSSNEIDNSRDGEFPLLRTNNRGDDTVGHWELLNIGFTLPQNTGAGNPPVDVSGAKTQIANWLAKEPCANFINNVLSKLGAQHGPLVEGTNVLKLFDDVAKEGGFVRGNPPDGLGRLEGGTFRGRINHNATIYLPGFDPSNKNPIPAQETLLDAGGIFHELLHLANGKTNDDLQLSKAIRDAGMGVNPWPKEKDNKNLAFSYYIHDALVKYCGTP